MFVHMLYSKQMKSGEWTQQPNLIKMPLANESVLESQRCRKADFMQWCVFGTLSASLQEMRIQLVWTRADQEAIYLRASHFQHIVQKPQPITSLIGVWARRSLPKTQV